MLWPDGSENVKNSNAVDIVYSPQVAAVWQPVAVTPLASFALQQTRDWVSYTNSRSQSKRISEQ
jgi:hypothetical protein